MNEWENREEDCYRYAIGNCYKTKEEAEEALEIKKIDTELRRYALEHNEEDIDWENTEQTKYSIKTDYYDKHIGISEWNYCKIPNQIYFTSEEIAKNAIEAIGKDRVEKWARY